LDHRPTGLRRKKPSIGRRFVKRPYGLTVAFAWRAALRRTFETLQALISLSLFFVSKLTFMRHSTWPRTRYDFIQLMEPDALGNRRLSERPLLARLSPILGLPNPLPIRLLGLQVSKDWLLRLRAHLEGLQMPAMSDSAGPSA
jgi:hypothetical protein